MIIPGNFRFPLRIQPLLYRFCKLFPITSNMSIKTFVFLDLETTGLPHLEHNRTKITEFCAIAVQADHIELGCFPRVHNKLSLCFNPSKTITPEVTAITGLSNDLLEKQGCFSSDVVDVIKKWLDMNQRPICFVAHNGNRFDYPIFRAEIERTGSSLPEDILCLDSLTAFKHIDKNNSFKEEPPKNDVPFEFNDDYDEILCQIAEEVEREQKLTPEERQKINETTPKKQMIPSQNSSNGKNGQAMKRLNSTSYKLGDIYSRLTSKPPMNLHEAEGDVVMLVTCAAVYGEKFVEYAKEHSVSFGSIPMMRPGKKIGF